LKNKWIQNNREEWKKYYKSWVKAHHKEHTANIKQWAKDNPESKKRSRKKWWNKLSDERKQEYVDRNNESQKHRYATDPIYREKIKQRSKLSAKKRYEKT